jgi:hypothetical protein
MHTTRRHHTHTPTPNLSTQIEKIYRVLGFHLTSLRGDQTTTRETYWDKYKKNHKRSANQNVSSASEIYECCTQ